MFAFFALFFRWISLKVRKENASDFQQAISNINESVFHKRKNI